MEDLLRFFKLIGDYLPKEKRLLCLIGILGGIYIWGIWKLIEHIEYMPLPFNVSANSFFERAILTSLIVVFSLIIVSIISLILKRWEFPIKLVVFMFIIELLLICVAYEHYKVEPFPTKSNALGIYIAEFRGDRDNKRREEIIQTLNNIISNHNLQHRVKIKKLNRIIYKSKQAKEVGKKGKAGLVLWGNFPSKVKIHPYISVVVRHYMLKKGKFTKFIKFIIGGPSGVICNLPKEKFPSELLEQPLSLIYFSLSFADIDREDYQNAISDLQEAVRGTDRKDILQYCYYYLGAVHLLSVYKSKNKKVHIDNAINYFKRLLKVKKLREDPLAYAAVEYGLAASYVASPVANMGEINMYLSKNELTLKLTLSKNQKEAVTALKRAINSIDRNRYRKEYAAYQMDLGNVYSSVPDLVIQDSCDSCQKAYQAYKEALRIFNPNEFPVLYALMEMNIGYFWERCGSGEIDKIKKSIVAYQKALYFFAKHKERYKFYYVNTLVNLGTDYDNLANLFQEQKRSKLGQYIPGAYCKLDNVYKHIKGSEGYKDYIKEYIKEYEKVNAKRNQLLSEQDKETSAFYYKAEKVYKEAFSIKGMNEYPELYGSINLNLGLLYKHIYNFTHKESYLDEALDYTNKALKIFKEDLFVYNHTLALNILLSIYSEYSMFQNSFPYFNPKVIDRIVNLIREGLSLIKKKDSPSQYMELQIQIGDICRDLISYFCPYSPYTGCFICEYPPPCIINTSTNRSVDIKEFKQALRQCISSCRTLYSYAQIGIEAYRKALEVFPKNPEVKFSMRTLYRESKQIHKLIDSYNSSLRTGIVNNLPLELIDSILYPPVLEEPKVGIVKYQKYLLPDFTSHFKLGAKLRP